ncbi:unnamed protein product [Adineta steineri]|uniref:Uncharacterized protein n=1 Tax=Adineta steineri TaxID=433720 RepID=A0A815P0J3_9BILA|nr:unnamed protein product [Adineta steineri]CAF1439545.1 unnamed protein product [Adineta steineri]CAF1441681.1 unnamed protein product [Adineta steineri]
MFFWRYFGLVGVICVCISYCQNDEPLSDDTDEFEEPVPPEYLVKLSVETEPKSHATTNTGEDGGGVGSSYDHLSEPFSCYNCTNCDSPSESSIRPCDAGINMCYKIQKRIDGKKRVIRRGCSTSKGQCRTPDSDQSKNEVDSVTCCTSPKCNQGIQLNPLFFLSIISFFIIIIII